MKILKYSLQTFLNLVLNFPHFIERNEKTKSKTKIKGNKEKEMTKFIPNLYYLILIAFIFNLFIPVNYNKNYFRQRKAFGT